MTQRNIDISTASEKLEMGRPCKQNEDSRLNTARGDEQGRGRRWKDDVEAGTGLTHIRRSSSGLTAKQSRTAEVVNMYHMPLLHDRSIFTPLFAFQQKIFF
jgi:hypothetical protein